MKEINLTKGMVALVDDEDYDYLNQWKWCAVVGTSGIFYAARAIGKVPNRKLVAMHRFLVHAPKGMKIDHRDGDGLNNQKYNLRVCSTSQNGMNSRKSKNNTTGYKGVYVNKSTNKYYSQIYVNKQHIHLGYFSNSVDAAKAYDNAAKKYFGEFAKTNFQ